jgi:hypothetical protein
LTAFYLNQKVKNQEEPQEALEELVVEDSEEAVVAPKVEADSAEAEADSEATEADSAEAEADSAVTEVDSEVDSVEAEAEASEAEDNKIKP